MQLQSIMSDFDPVACSKPTREVAQTIDDQTVAFLSFQGRDNCTVVARPLESCRCILIGARVIQCRATLMDFDTVKLILHSAVARFRGSDAGIRISIWASFPRFRT